MIGCMSVISKLRYEATQEAKKGLTQGACSEIEGGLDDYVFDLDLAFAVYLKRVALSLPSQHDDHDRQEHHENGNILEEALTNQALYFPRPSYCRLLVNHCLGVLRDTLVLIIRMSIRVL